MIEFLTFLLFVVTAAYVALTYELAKSAAESVRIARSQYVLAKQPTVFMNSRGKATFSDRKNPRMEALQNILVSMRVVGEYPAFDVQMSMLLDQPGLEAVIHVQETSFHPGATYLPEERQWGAFFNITQHPHTDDLSFPLRGVVLLSYEDLFGTRWTGRWRLELQKGETEARVDLIDLTNPHLPPMPAQPPAP